MSSMIKGLAGRLSLILVAVMLFSIVFPGYAAVQIASGSIEISSLTDVSGSININVGKGEGLKVGTKGVIMRDGKQIAEYVVDRVNWGFSRIIVSNVAPGVTIRPGDSAPITSTPDKAPTSSGKKKPPKMMWALAGIAAIAVLLGGRHGGGGGSPNNTIVLTAQKSSNADGSSVITLTANVKDDKGFAVVDGTPVTFSSTAGTLNHSATTTIAGRATASLSIDATEPAQTAVVTAKSGDRTATMSVSLKTSIDLVASPTTIQIVGSGGSHTSSIITATCKDASGNPATTASGKVTFTTSLGTLTPSDPIDVNNSGVATTTLTCNAAGTATVNASWSKSKSTATVTVTAGPPYSLSVASNTASVQCDGNSFATITTTVKDVGGNLAANGTIVNFSVIPDGSGGGNGSIAAQAATVNGIATAFLFTRDALGATSISGRATVKAQVLRASQPSTVPLPTTDLTNQGTTVEFVSNQVVEIHLAADPTNIRGWDMVGKTTTISAVVYNGDHKAVPNGTVVHFSASHGLLSGSGTSATNNGIATTTLSADASGNPTWNGLVDVTALAGAVTSTGTGLVIFSGAPSPSHCTANMTLTTIPPLHGQATITVTAHDINDHPVADGTKVTVDTDRGTISSREGATAGGIANFTLLTSAADGPPAVPTPTGAGTVSISIDSGGTNAETGGAPVTLTIPFTVGP